MCVKSLLKPYIYRNNKEFYNCDIDKIKNVMLKCKNFVTRGYHCKKCSPPTDEMSKLIKENNTELFENLLNNSKNEPNYYFLYSLYKGKYSKLKSQQ